MKNFTTKVRRALRRERTTNKKLVHGDHGVDKSTNKRKNRNRATEISEKSPRTQR